MSTTRGISRSGFLLSSYFEYSGGLSQRKEVRVPKREKDSACAKLRPIGVFTETSGKGASHKQRRETWLIPRPHYTVSKANRTAA